MKAYQLHEYRDAECPYFIESPQSFFMVLQASGGKVCDTGCWKYENGKCPGFRKLTMPSMPEAGQKPQETVRETAARLGISISEVRRRRKDAA